MVARTNPQPAQISRPRLHGGRAAAAGMVATVFRAEGISRASRPLRCRSLSSGADTAPKQHTALAIRQSFVVVFGIVLARVVGFGDLARRFHLFRQHTKIAGTARLRAHFDE